MTWHPTLPHQRAHNQSFFYEILPLAKAPQTPERLLQAAGWKGKIRAMQVWQGPAAPSMLTLQTSDKDDWEQVSKSKQTQSVSSGEDNHMDRICMFQYETGNMQMHSQKYSAQIKFYLEKLIQCNRKQLRHPHPEDLLRTTWSKLQ